MCDAPTRLVGIEPHPTRAHTDLRTYQCLACDHMQAAVVPLGGSVFGDGRLRPEAGLS